MPQRPSESSRPIDRHARHSEALLAEPPPHEVAADARVMPYAGTGSGLGVNLHKGPGFWRRQFGERVTAPQIAFDLIFGILLPITCLLMDPIVFTDEGLVALLPHWRSPAYVFICVVFVALAAWLLGRERVGAALPIVAGVLLAGAVGAAGIGLVVLPIAAIGLALLIGALGFTPWATVFACIRCGVRATRAAHHRSRRPEVTTGLVLVAALAALALPLVMSAVQTRVRERYIAALQSGDPPRATAARHSLAQWGWAMAPERLPREYKRRPQAPRAAALAEAYMQMTGRSIETTDWAGWAD
ncbi:MAG: hypothetical protein LC135_15615 [Phycisphaerae bacterium]|nr:hypothetical protein [Phycisphaerae bacterium]MCZ2401269.1 hypothetical protein [Phycisphaerae bacterium]